MDNIEHLIDTILTRNMKQVYEDSEYRDYLKMLFRGYKSRKYTYDLIYETVMSNKLQYWFDVQTRIIWKPVFHNFSGVYIIESDQLIKQLPIQSYQNEFVQNNNSTPLEWMAVTMTYNIDYVYNERFKSRINDMFYRAFRYEKSEKWLKQQNFFENTLIVALDLSTSLYKDKIEKIQFVNKNF